MEPENTKALLRRAQAFRHTDKFKEAKLDVIKAYQLAPTSLSICKEVRPKRFLYKIGVRMLTAIPHRSWHCAIK